MTTSRQTRALLVATLTGSAWLAPATQLSADPVDDFAIVDTNTTSPRFDTVVSPRDYLHQVSGYYFGNPG